MRNGSNLHDLPSAGETIAPSSWGIVRGGVAEKVNDQYAEMAGIQPYTKRKGRRRPSVEEAVIRRGTVRRPQGAKGMESRQRKGLSFFAQSHVQRFRVNFKSRGSRIHVAIRGHCLAAWQPSTVYNEGEIASATIASNVPTPFPGNNKHPHQAVRRNITWKGLYFGTSGRSRKCRAHDDQGVSEGNYNANKLVSYSLEEKRKE